MFVLPRDSRAAALHHAFDFGKRHHGRIAWRRHSQRAVGGAAFNGPLRAFVHQEPVDQSRGETVAAADPIVDFQILSCC